ncbi:TfoX/Sxy family protein [Sciscionella sediminilitoris]|uniref:TfoX/Sxy family protein n=1 Tax=Sciscionella sediminilitoris TaxID=1445613 RepID=UPI0004DFB24E|nr:TfoX/Sxy family protein [Sciscionella sp. SE31]
MAYDEDVADRIREALSGEVVREQRMFGGLSFMVHEKMVAALNGDRVLLRCAAERAEELIEDEGADPAMMRGKEMAKGWIEVDLSRFGSAEDTGFWITAALDHNRAVTGN